MAKRKYKWRSTAAVVLASTLVAGALVTLLAIGYDDYSYLGLLLGGLGVYVSLTPVAVKNGFSNRRQFKPSDVVRLFKRDASPTWRDLWEDEDLDAVYVLVGAIPLAVGFAFFFGLSDSAAKWVIGVSAVLLIIAGAVLGFQTFKQHERQLHGPDQSGDPGLK